MREPRRTDTERRTCSRCACVGAVLLCVLGLPLVVYNGPACFFADGSYIERLYDERQAHLLAYNQTVAAWAGGGRQRCSRLTNQLTIKVSLVAPAGSDDPWELQAPLVQRNDGDVIPDLLHGDAPEGVAQPLRTVAPAALDVFTAQARAGALSLLKFELITRGTTVATLQIAPVHDRQYGRGTDPCRQIVPPTQGLGSARSNDERWCVLRALSFVLADPDDNTTARSGACDRACTGGLNTGELHSSLGIMMMENVPSNEYVYGEGPESPAVLALRDIDGNRAPAVRPLVDITVRCANDPYVLAASSTNLRFDFGLTSDKYRACTIPHVPCTRYLLRK